MIIGIDASRANRDHKSGTEWYSYYLIRNLAALDDKNEYILYTDRPLQNGLVDLTLPDAESVSWKTGPDDINFDIKGFQKIKSPHDNVKAKVLNWPFNLFWTQGRLSLEMILHRPRILFVPAHTLPFLHPRRSVVTIHDVGFLRDIGLYRREDFSGRNIQRHAVIHVLARLFTFGKYRAEAVDYLRWSTEFAIKHAQKVISISEFTKQEIGSQLTVKPEKIEVVLNGYNDQLFAPIAERARIDAVLDKNGIPSPYLLYVGRIDKKKNLVSLIEAFYLFKQSRPGDATKLVLVGDAMYGFDDIKYAIREFDLANDVILTGWVEEIDLPALYNGAEAFVFPSKYEGFGIPILQAMASGVPVLASDAASIPEVAGGAAKLFDPNDPHQMAEAFAQVIGNEPERQKMRAAGLKRVKKFSWRQCASDTLRVLESL